MHQRTGQQQQQRQRAEEVGTVLAQQKVGGNGTHDEQPDGVAGTPEAFWLGVIVRVAVIHAFFQRSKKTNASGG